MAVRIILNKDSPHFRRFFKQVRIFFKQVRIFFKQVRILIKHVVRIFFKPMVRILVPHRPKPPGRILYGISGRNF